MSKAAALRFSYNLSVSDRTVEAVRGAYWLSVIVFSVRFVSSDCLYLNMIARENNSESSTTNRLRNRGNRLMFEYKVQPTMSNVFSVTTGNIRAVNKQHCLTHETKAQLFKHEQAILLQTAGFLFSFS